MRIVPATPEGIAEAAALIRSGAIVAYPTETVYGLAADPFSDSAIRKLFAVKGRADTNPVLLVGANIEQIQAAVGQISPGARNYIDWFWPGPLSLVLPKSESVSADACAGGSKVCVRVTAYETARLLCLAVGHAITSTSANRSGCPAARSAREIELDGVSLCIDGGVLAPSLPSTVFDPDSRTVHREGAVPGALLLDG